MDLSVLMSYRLVVSPDEFRVISKALRGTLTPEEQVVARELQEKLHRERLKQAEQWVKEAGKAVANIEAGKETA